MANTTNRKPTAVSKATSKTAVVEEATVSSTSKPAIVPKDIDSSQYVNVRNGFQGTLVYQSKKTGEVFIWDSFGDEQEMELRELKNAKNSSKAFFVNNWFMFDEDWIVDYLGVKNFYKYAIPIEDFDTIFDTTPKELKAAIEAMSDGQKSSLAYRARLLIAEGKIDSLSIISTIEKALGIELIER